MAKHKIANEHYVPQVCLKSYSNQKEQCYVYDKDNKKYIAKSAERFIIANQNMEHKSFWIVM